MNRTPYHILRCQIRELGNLPEETYTIDSILKIEYMGAAEYEFGAVPNSLQHLVYSDLTSSQITINGKCFFLLKVSAPTMEQDLQDQKEIQEAFNQMAAGSWSTKMGNGVHSYFEPDTVTRFKKGCKQKTETVPNPFKMETNFWWDIDNHYMVWPSDSPLALNQVLWALRHLFEQNWNRPLWYKKPFRVQDLIKSIQRAANDLYKR